MTKNMAGFKDDSREVDLSKVSGMGNGNTVRGFVNEACFCDGSCEKPFDAKREAVEYWTKEEDVEDVEEDSSNITVTVTADVGDAITGFKALSRELRETTKAARELEQAYKDVSDAFEKVEPVAKKCGVSNEELLSAILVQLGNSD